jgi:hypothetical protein
VRPWESVPATPPKAEVAAGHCFMCPFDHVHREPAVPAFDRQSTRGSERIGFEAETLIMAGWTGRGRAAVQQHVEELAAAAD